jgi:ankyrin repeat protein
VLWGVCRINWRIQKRQTLADTHAVFDVDPRAALSCCEKPLFGGAPVSVAARYGDIGALTAILSCGANPNELPGLPLAVLALCDRQDSVLECARLLITHGADVNRQTIEGYTPLYQCAVSGNTELAKLLIDEGADVNKPSVRGNTPLHGIAEATPFFDAVVPINVPRSMLNQLHTNDRTRRTILALLRGGADLSLRNNAGLTCRQVAAESAIREVFDDAIREFEDETKR